MDIFSLRFKELRLKKGVSRLKLAKEIGLSLKSIISYEKGKSLPQYDNFIKICQYFHVSADHLLGLVD